MIQSTLLSKLLASATVKGAIALGASTAVTLAVAAPMAHQAIEARERSTVQVADGPIADGGDEDTVSGSADSAGAPSTGAASGDSEPDGSLTPLLPGTTTTIPSGSASTISPDSTDEPDDEPGTSDDASTSNGSTQAPGSSTGPHTSPTTTTTPRSSSTTAGPPSTTPTPSIVVPPGSTGGNPGSTGGPPTSAPPVTTPPAPTTTTTTTTQPAFGDLVVTINGESVPADGIGGATVTVHNSGTAALSGVALEIRIERAVLDSFVAPGWTCTGGGRNCTYGGTLAPGASASITVSLRVQGNGVTNVSVRASGVAESDTGNPADNSTTLTLPVV